MFEIVSHTADVRIRIENASLAGLFEDAGRALVAFSEVDCDRRTSEAREITIESADLSSLLVDFMNELLALLHVERLAFERFDGVDVAGSRLRCSARFHPATTWSEEVKAATYHDARVTRGRELWSVTVVLDI